MKKLKSVMMWVFAFIILISGFKDLTELENRDFIIALGIDKSKKNDLEVTALSGDYNYFQEKTSDNKSHTHTAKASNINMALKKINKGLEKKIYLGHMQIIFLGKSLSKDKNLLKKTIDDLESNSSINQKIKLIYTKDAKKKIVDSFKPDLLDFIKNKTSKKSLTLGKLYSKLQG